MKLFNPENAHWYRRDGEPLHSVPSAKGEPRPTTLRDARKLGLLPSVTNVLGVIAKPELTAWLQEQAVMAALTLPRIAGEAEDAFAKRVVEDSLTTRDNAAEFGTGFHHGAERVAQTLEVDPQDPAADWLRHYRDWYQAQVRVLHWTERALVEPLRGFAGTADLLVEHREHGLCLVDLKTMKVRPGEKPKPYKSWCYQLAAYRDAVVTGDERPVKCLNLIVNSLQAGPPVEHVWSEEELRNGLEAFYAAHRLWCIEKGYDPSEDAQKDAKDQKGSSPMVLVA
jgi:hypothetical protein